MIVLTEKQDRSSSSWCIVCIEKCGRADPMVCDQCLGYVTTHYTCPDCDLEGEYNGCAIPEFCDCGYFYPDLNFLKEDLESRIDFYMRVS